MTVTRKRKGPRIKVDCPHGGKHQHGTPAGYSEDGCRCDDCTDAKSAYWARMSKLKAYGRWVAKHVDPAGAREHLAKLRAAGLGIRTIEKHTGVDDSTLRALAAGQYRRIDASTAERLLAMPLDTTVAAGAVVDGTGSRRRLQALIAIGWSESKLAAQLGLTTFSVHWLFEGNNTTRETADSIRDLYERVWDTPPPQDTTGDKAAATRSINRAARNDWPPPLAWDDDTIDDPATEPHEARRNEKRKQRVTADVLEDLDWLRRTGAHPDTAAERVGMTRRTLEREAHRAGMHDLATWIHRKDLAA